MSLRDDMLKHRIALQRLSVTQKSVIQSSLKQLLDKAKMEATAGTKGAALTASLRSSIASLRDTAIDSLTEIATYESKFVAKLLNTHFNADAQPLDSSVINKELLAQTMAINKIKKSGDGTVLDTSARNRSVDIAYKQYGQRKADELVQIIKDGETKGTGLTETLNFLSERVAGLQTAQAIVLANTSVNYAANVGKMETFLDNPEIVERVVWTNDLDSNVCSDCESLDGEIYSVDEAPDWPAHWNCACDLVPV